MVLQDLAQSAIADNVFNVLTHKIKHCDYFDSDSIPSFDPLINRLFALHINVRLLQKNFDDLCHLASQLNSSPNLICETRLNDSSNTRLTNIPGYQLLHKNSKSKAGRVAMYIMEELNYELVETYSIYHEGCEDLWIKLRFDNGESLLVGVLYRHPKSNDDDFAVKL